MKSIERVHACAYLLILYCPWRLITLKSTQERIYSMICLGLFTNPPELRRQLNVNWNASREIVLEGPFRHLWTWVSTENETLRLDECRRGGAWGQIDTAGRRLMRKM